MGNRKNLVNSVSIQNCFAFLGEHKLAVLDVSYQRLIVEKQEIEIPIEAELSVNLVLDKQKLFGFIRYSTENEHFIRFDFTRVPHSQLAHLRTFLSPKKVGESLIEDWSENSIRHYHGLNDSEIWFDGEGGVVFSYLDQYEVGSQFIIRLKDFNSALKVGKMPRADYMKMKNIDDELTLLALNEKDTYARISECRDIVTNFRPVTSLEYQLKQKLLKILSESLYSTGTRVDYMALRQKSLKIRPTYTETSVY